MALENNVVQGLLKTLKKWHKGAIQVLSMLEKISFGPKLIEGHSLLVYIS